MNYFENQFKRKVACQVKQHCSIFLFWYKEMFVDRMRPS